MRNLQFSAILDNVISHQHQQRTLDDREVIYQRISIAELLLQAETGESPPLPIITENDVVDAETQAFLQSRNTIIILEKLELMICEIISVIARKSIYTWMEKLLHHVNRTSANVRIEVYGTFWDMSATEGDDSSNARSMSINSKRKIFSLFKRIVTLKEDVNDISRLAQLSLLPMPDAEFWANVVGYEEVKRTLNRLVRWRWYRKSELNRFGLLDASSTGGILLHGPSGCGKTFLAQQLGRETGVRFVTLKASDIFSKWFGESEKAVRQAFSAARAKKPCILFLDEIDALAPSRKRLSEDGEVNSVSSRVLSTLLNELDGVDTENHDMVVIAATSRVEVLDEAVIRPGRLGSKVLIDVPSQEDRVMLFRHFLKDTPLAPGLDVNLLASKSFGHSIAQIQNSCSLACFQALREDSEYVTLAHLDKALISF
jgi:SpoVK/Ycf46/Vps4 family AAA+-type ATPase